MPTCAINEFNENNRLNKIQKLRLELKDGLRGVNNKI